MNPLEDPIFAGIAGIEMEPDEFDLGNGLVLRQTYAHLMAPFLMAFAPAEKGKPHPAPWSAVSNGLAVDVRLELYVPQDFAKPNFFDRLNTVWWIAALLRLKGAAEVHVPVLSDRRFQNIPKDSRNAQLVPVEVLPRRQLTEAPLRRLENEHLLWLRDTWMPGGELMDRCSVFNDAFQAFDSIGNMPSPAVAMVTVWGALEHLFSPAKHELRFRVAANIASYLEPAGASRLALHGKIMKLYDARSSVAHGTRLKSTEAWRETMSIARRALLKILASGSVPTKAEMEQAIFAPVKSG